LKMKEEAKLHFCGHYVLSVKLSFAILFSHKNIHQRQALLLICCTHLM